MATIGSPLVLTQDDSLSADLARFAAAAGVVPTEVRDLAGAMRSWSSAPLVLVGYDVAPDLVDRAPIRRSSVHVVGRDLSDRAWRDAMGIGAESVIDLARTPTGLTDVLADLADGPSRAGRVIGVVGGTGGSGASIFAAALAQVLAAERPTLLVDADRVGAAAERVLGVEDRTGIRWDALASESGRLSGRSLSEALPRVGSLRVLGWPTHSLDPVPPDLVREVLDAGSRAFDVVVVDLPRYPDPATAEVWPRLDELVMLATLTLPGVAGAARFAEQFQRPWRLVLREVRGGVPAREAAKLLDGEVLAVMAPQRRLDEGIGLGAGPLRHKRGVLMRATRGAVKRLGLAG